jgi:hypothetical protein
MWPLSDFLLQGALELAKRLSKKIRSGLTGDPTTESSLGRAARDFPKARHTLSFHIAQLLAAGLTGWWAYEITSSANVSNRVAGVVTALGVVTGPLVVLILVFCGLAIRAPYRQRDETRGELAELDEEVDAHYRGLKDGLTQRIERSYVLRTMIRLAVQMDREDLGALPNEEIKQLLSLSDEELESRMSGAIERSEKATEHVDSWENDCHVFVMANLGRTDAALFMDDQDMPPPPLPEFDVTKHKYYAKLDQRVCRRTYRLRELIKREGFV